MHTAHLLCLAALSTSTLITCYQVQKETIQTDLTRENPSNTEVLISIYGYFLMMKFSNRMRKAIYQKSKGDILLKKQGLLLTTLYIKLNIICLDTTKNTYISVNNGINKDCFKTIHGKNSHHALCPWRNDAMIKLVGAKSHTEAYSAELHHSLQSNNYKTHLRRRRSQYIDPSDPLGFENPRSRTTNNRRSNQEHEHEHERSSNVSKETITSYDDPLHILLSKSPVSPNLQKQKKNKQVAPSDPF